MDKNKKLIFCLIGSFFLSMVSSPIFSYCESAFYFNRPFGATIFGIIIHYTIDIISIVGFLLFIVFSILVILNNIHIKK